MKSESIYDLLKIPDSVLLKNALIENGKLKSYIEELEYKITNEGISSLVDSCRQLKANNKDLTKKNKELLGRKYPE